MLLVTEESEENDEMEESESDEHTDNKSDEIEDEGSVIDSV